MTDSVSSEDASAEKLCPRCSLSLGGDPPDQCPRCLLRPEWDTPLPIAITLGPGQTFTPPSIDELSEHLVGYEVDTLIGRGGMGAVYRGRQASLDRPVAIKILPPTIAERPGFRERFAREAKALAKLNHPNIVAVYDYGQAGPYAMLVMELVEGANLREVLAQGRLAPVEAMEIIPQLCDALTYAHETGVVHRDIKPENLLFDGRGRLKITDFGLAKLLGKSDTPQPLENDPPAGSTDQSLHDPTMGVVGTVHYMAPEQLENPRSVDHRADIYALGVVFYEMLTGELPIGRFDPPSQRVADSQQGGEGKGNAVQIDVRLDEVVLRALQKRPEKRYASASELMDDIDHLDDEDTSFVKSTATSARKFVATSARSATATAGGFWNNFFQVLRDSASWAHAHFFKNPPMDLLAFIAFLFLTLGGLIGAAVMSGPSLSEEGFMVIFFSAIVALVLARVSLAHQSSDESERPRTPGQILNLFTLGVLYTAILAALVVLPIASVFSTWLIVCRDVRNVGDPGWIRDWTNLACFFAIGLGTFWLVIAAIHKAFPAALTFVFRPYLKPWSWKPLFVTVILLGLIIVTGSVTLSRTWFRPLDESDYVSDSNWHELSLYSLDKAQREKAAREKALKLEMAQ